MCQLQSYRVVFFVELKYILNSPSPFIKNVFCAVFARLKVSSSLGETLL